MKITAVGLGLIGGSLCKHIKKHTDYTVGGIDINPETIKMALSQNAIDYEEKEPGSGDIDGNGTTNVTDAILALRMAMGIAYAGPEQIEAGDMNGNGTIDVTDAILIMRAAMGL